MMVQLSDHMPSSHRSSQLDRYQASLVAGWLVFCLLVSVLPLAKCQERRERTLEEIKTEAIKRAENGMYPLIGLDSGDVQEAFQSIKTTDKDEWAAAFMGVADRYLAEGKSRETSERGGCTRLDGGRFRLHRASRSHTRKPSPPSSRTPIFGIRRSRLFTFRLKARRSSATCGCPRMPMALFRS